MAKKYDFDDSDGVWRTVGGRRIFIKNGQDLASAMIESGKFKNLRNTYRKGKEKELAKEQDKKEEKEWDKSDEDMLKSIYTYSNEEKNVEEDSYYKDLVEKYGKESVASKYKELQDKYDIVPNTYTDSEGVTYNSLKEKKDKSDDEYALYKKAKENPDSIDPMTENSTDWEALDKKYKDRYDREFKASMGEVDIPDNFVAQFNDYAKEQEEKERLEIAKDIAKEVYGLNDKNASPERIEKEAKKILEPQDGEVLEKGDTPYTNAKGELERSTKSLKEWRDELKKTSENKDGFTQYNTQYGGTREYDKEQLDRMAEHGTKPMKNSYSGYGWEGTKYDSSLSTKDIAKNITDYSKKEFPDVKLSRKTDYNGVDLYVTNSDKDLYIDDKYIDSLSNKQLIDLTNDYGNQMFFDRWAKDNVPSYSKDHSFTADDVRRYMKEDVAKARQHEMNVSGNEYFLSDYGKKVISGLNKEMNSYNYDDSDGQIDYFNTNFYGYVHIGKYDKPYQVNSSKSTNETKKNTIADTIARNNELNKKLASEGRTYDDHLIEKRTNGKYKTMDEVLDTAQKMSTNETMNNAIREKAGKTKSNYYEGTKRWGFGYANDDNIPVYQNKIDYSGDFTHANLSKVSDDDLVKIANKQNELYNEATGRQVGDRRTYNGKKDQIFKTTDTLKYGNGLDVVSNEMEKRGIKADNKITNTLRQKAYKKYLKEHPNSKKTFDDFMK